VNTDIIVEQALYPAESIMGTAYVFTDRCYVLLDRTADGKVKVSLAAKSGTSPEAFAAITGEFQNELLAQALRHHIAKQHEKVREIIVARALFGAAPQVEAPLPVDDAKLGLDPRFVPASDDDFLEDPLGIAVPWEEKYGTDSSATAGDAAAGSDAPREPK
jgi:His-Xaa-Ser system protein HxsD